MPTQYTPRIVNFEEQDIIAIHQVASAKGLGSKGFSAAVRFMIREWIADHNFLLPPLPSPDLSNLSPPEVSS